MKTKINVISFATKEVVHSVDVTGRNERDIDKIDSGMNRNLNHEEYYTLIEKS